MIFYIVLPTELTCTDVCATLERGVQNSQWLWTLEGNDQNSDLIVVWSGTQNYLWGS